MINPTSIISQLYLNLYQYFTHLQTNHRNKKIQSDSSTLEQLEREIYLPRMFSPSLEFSDEEDGSESYDENHLQNLEAVNIRILQNKRQFGGFIRSDLAEDINLTYNLDSLVTKSLLDLTRVEDDRTEDDDNLDGCDNNQDIAGPEQTQLSATILGNSQQLILST